MENFSLATDTDLYLDLKVRIAPLIGNGSPRALIVFGDVAVFDGPMNRTTTLCGRIELCDDILIRIHLNDKVYDETKETAMQIESITVDGLEIKDYCYDFIDYSNDKDVQEKTLYLGFNGVCMLHIPGPFYRWWHTVTGQGWLLSGARSRSHSYAANLTSTKGSSIHNDVGNSIATNDPTRAA